MEEVLRVLVLGGLAIWAVWGFMVGLRAKEVRLDDVTGPPEASHGAREDEDEGGSARLRA